MPFSSAHLVSLPELFHCLATKTIDTDHEIYKSEFVKRVTLARCDGRHAFTQPLYGLKLMHH